MNTAGQNRDWTTYDDAEKASPFVLAQHWGDRSQWPYRAVEPVTARDELHELATMTALSKWLQRWTPLQIHHAIRAGATVPDVAAAAGIDPSTARDLWTSWAAGQRDLHDRDTAEGRPAPNGITAAEATRVMRSFRAHLAKEGEAGQIQPPGEGNQP